MLRCKHLRYNDALRCPGVFFFSPGAEEMYYLRVMSKQKKSIMCFFVQRTKAGFFL